MTRPDESDRRSAVAPYFTVDMDAATTVCQRCPAGGRGPAPLLDARSLGRPPSFAGERDGWREWVFTFMGHIASHSGDAASAISWESSQTDPLIMAEVAVEDPEYEHMRYS